MATALETSIQAEITAMPAGIRREMAQEKLTEYIAAKAQLITTSANDITSYTIAGRSVSRRTGSEFAHHIKELETELFGLIYGENTILSFSASAAI